jgi:D-serine deaminase-like pyridoxal phosphate-dependent protein
MLTTLVGRPVAELDTPALLIDLDALEQNISTMANDIAERGASWRPHSKANKCPAIVHKEIQAGAIGVACAKLGEAEVMAANGIDNILVPNQIVGPIKARRLAALAGQCRITVAVDSAENVRELDPAAREQGTHPQVVIEVNVGMERCGVTPGEAALALAQEIASCQGLKFAGVMAWEGHCMAIDDPVEREAAIRNSCQMLVDTAELIRANGIPVEVVSAGGTGTYLTAASVEGITEVQAGGGIFGDQVYLDLGANVRPALTLLTQVTSRPSPDRIIVDAGRKTIDPSSRTPTPQGIDGVKSIAFSAEHGIIQLDHPTEAPRVAERVEFRIGYADQCNHLHEHFYGIRNGVVETIWPILGRGRLQ